MRIRVRTKTRAKGRPAATRPTQDNPSYKLHCSADIEVSSSMAGGVSHGINGGPSEPGDSTEVRGAAEQVPMPFLEALQDCA